MPSNSVFEVNQPHLQVERKATIASSQLHLSRDQENVDEAANRPFFSKPFRQFLTTTHLGHRCIIIDGFRKFWGTVSPTIPCKRHRAQGERSGRQCYAARRRIHYDSRFFTLPSQVTVQDSQYTLLPLRRGWRTILLLKIWQALCLKETEALTVTV